MQSAPLLLILRLFLKRHREREKDFCTAEAETKEQVCGLADKPVRLRGQKGGSAQSAQSVRDQIKAHGN